MASKLEYVWIILLLLALSFGQHLYLSKKLASIYQKTDDIERFLLEGTCD